MNFWLKGGPDLKEIRDQYKQDKVRLLEQIAAVRLFFFNYFFQLLIFQYNKVEIPHIVATGQYKMFSDLISPTDVRSAISVMDGREGKLKHTIFFLKKKKKKSSCRTVGISLEKIVSKYAKWTASKQSICKQISEIKAMREKLSLCSEKLESFTGKLNQGCKRLLDTKFQCQCFFLFFFSFFFLFFLFFSFFFFFFSFFFFFFFSFFFLFFFFFFLFFFSFSFSFLFFFLLFFFFSFFSFFFSFFFIFFSFSFFSKF